ncbi:hypothetical protein PR003_g29751 [Phytophthora rubi]|uniref:BED-type domain-containing protein n=1 Tax=Phytophthora rubi TaxID=129364 RepID=A0A6A4BIT5_9STRA|nr:hypothetical protein PR003_g29750 [Phytophthora rubi]KAE9273963.1 hypothetical protein PR003_g29751 [Phytophthora rubi]
MRTHWKQWWQFRCSTTTLWRCWRCPARGLGVGGARHSVETHYAHRHGDTSK